MAGGGGVHVGKRHPPPEKEIGRERREGWGFRVLVEGERDVAFRGFIAKAGFWISLSELGGREKNTLMYGEPPLFPRGGEEKILHGKKETKNWESWLVRRFLLSGQTTERDFSFLGTSVCE